MKYGDVLHGFEITRVRELNELDATLYEMRHAKSGAELAWLQRPDQNKMFSIAFKTLPEDDTGVFHILEHSVLNGSKRFPTKEPFVGLLKGSMKTFLNAMTFPDKTLYPVSSRNEADFINLMTVYLDAVFCPAIYGQPNIFLQEGWHYELRKEQDEPIYKGVVFNEMKGAYAAVDNVMRTGMSRLLFPDTCYRFDAGGNPVHIPELTYEQFLAAHRKYYHPSNARVILDGDLPIEQVLSLIDGEYLSGYDQEEQSIGIAMQTPVSGVEAVQHYEVVATEATAGKAQFTMGKIVGTWADKEKSFALRVLCDYLAGSNEAPLKKAILKEGLGQDVHLRLMEHTAQPWLSLEVRNTDYAQHQLIKGTLRATLQVLVETGLDREELEATINRMEFQLREHWEPRGLVFVQNALRSWLYDGDPALYLTSKDTFDALRDKLQTNYFEQLLADTLLEDEGVAILHTLPSATLSEERVCKEAERLAAARASWSEAERQRIIAKNRDLEAWQKTPDSEAATATLPKLKLTDVAPEPERLLTEVALSSTVRDTVLDCTAY